MNHSQDLNMTFHLCDNDSVSIYTPEIAFLPLKWEMLTVGCGDETVFLAEQHKHLSKQKI
jgi:hypothetical protein